jgi:transposase, IS6 family
MRNRKNPFKGRQFTAEVILWAVRWYLQFPISYRDLELMLQDRGVSVDHTTVYESIKFCGVLRLRRLVWGCHLRPWPGTIF